MLRRRRPRPLYVLVAGALGIVMMTAGLGAAEPSDSWEGVEREWPEERPREAVAEDRFAMAGGCYAIRTTGGRYLVRSGDGFAATGAVEEEAEPFYFQATDLGRYLLFGSADDFLAASEGLAGEAAYGVTRSTPGGVAGGVTMEQTDAAADGLARSEVNRAAGRGDSVVVTEEPSELADWEVTGDGPFTIALPETDQVLTATSEGELVLEESDAESSFTFELTEGCAVFPEIEVNVEGPLLGGAAPFQEVRGFLEGHLHMMAYEFLGGRARCGRPWHRFGVAHALVDCPDHEPGGFGAVLEGVVSHGSPDGRHHTDGWPTFEGWPKYNSLTHEQVYYKWLERAWRGGLRLFVNLLVDNGQLCQAYPYKRNSCNEMDGVRLQAERIRELQDYIDAQSGGPGKGWFRIVEDPFEARRVINEGKLAVVLGIEVSVPLDCGLIAGDVPRCTEEEVKEGLEEVYELGVRQMELVNKFDNAFSGVTGDSGATGPVVNAGNFGENQRFWRIETCGEDDRGHDKTQPNFHDESGAPDEFSGRDSIFGAVLALAGETGAAPVYPEGPHCNVLGLSDLGRTMIAEMARLGMIFDPDHMSARARHQALDFIEDELERVHGHPYSGLISSHSWADNEIYRRIYELGGVVTPHAGGSAGFVDKWRQHKGWEDERFYFGFGFGSDVNGLSTQGAPRGADVPDPVEYPFAGFGGATVHRQQSGTRTYDINADGVDHYGLYPDWIEDLRRQAGDQIVGDLERGAEAYLQMWERAIGIAPNACRGDVDDLTDADLERLDTGMDADEVLWMLGQPAARTAAGFSYCLTGDRTARLSFAPDGSLAGWVVDGEGDDQEAQTVLTLTDAVATRSEPAVARATLLKESGEILAGRTIEFFVEERSKGEVAFSLVGSAQTDGDGVAAFEVPARYVSKQPRPIRAFFAGGDGLQPASASAFAYRE